jgi:tellurite resistance protein TehA-like permease
VLYILIWALILMRFYFYPYTFKASFTHPTESLFVPAFAVSFGTILINIVEYGFGKVGNWLNEAVVVLFWFDLALAVTLSVGIYLILYVVEASERGYGQLIVPLDGQRSTFQSQR